MQTLTKPQTLLATSIDEIELLESWYDEDASVRVRFGMGLDASTGAAASSTFFFEVPEGCRTPWHTHSAEEVVYVVEGSAEAGIGDERARLEPGGIAIIPASVPHGLENVGEGGLRFVGFFAAAAMVHVLDGVLQPLGTRVIVTPSTEEA